MASFEEVQRPTREFNLRLTEDEIWALWNAAQFDLLLGNSSSATGMGVRRALGELIDKLDNDE